MWLSIESQPWLLISHQKHGLTGVQEKQVSEISRRFRRYRNTVFAAGRPLFCWERWIWSTGEAQVGVGLMWDSHRTLW